MTKIKLALPGTFYISTVGYKAVWHLTTHAPWYEHGKHLRHASEGLTCVCERQMHSGMQLTTRMLWMTRRVNISAKSSSSRHCNCMVSPPASATRLSLFTHCFTLLSRVRKLKLSLRSSVDVTHFKLIFKRNPTCISKLLPDNADESSCLLSKSLNKNPKIY